ncbi:MAG: glycosyltransferase family 2 protein [Elusimicrobia bacterium]|nr:glycosyltransferase family 2 protein [Elusimicrobiota bacterium]
MKPRKLSVLVPVYNEAATVETLIGRVRSVKLPASLELEVVAVDDGSTDGTAAALERLAGAGLVVERHGRNRGKGAALRTALARATGDFVLVQDADLEYDPADYPALLAPLLDGRADAVYGSRFLGGPHRVLLFWHYAANKLFTLLTNVLYNVNLSDMGVCYKAFRADLLRSFPLREDRFGFEPEVTAKVAKGGWRIYEVGISYSGRTYAEGKKIGLKDAFQGARCIVRYSVLWDRTIGLLTTGDPS